MRWEREKYCSTLNALHLQGFTGVVNDFTLNTKPFIKCCGVIINDCCVFSVGGMFTANTMSSIVETLGLTLPGARYCQYFHGLSYIKKRYFRFFVIMEITKLCRPP